VRPPSVLVLIHQSFYEFPGFFLFILIFLVTALCRGIGGSRSRVGIFFGLLLVGRNVFNDASGDYRPARSIHAKMYPIVHCSVVVAVAVGAATVTVVVPALGMLSDTGPVCAVPQLAPAALQTVMDATPLEVAGTRAV
jgi:hypothetical protein